MFVDNVVHFEIPATNVERAQKFYWSTFGWTMKPVPEMDYTIVLTGEIDSNNMPKKSGYINGGMMEKTKLLKHPIITIGVADIDRAIANAVKNGGSLVVNKSKTGEYGYSAYIKDTEDNIFGLWQPLMKMPNEDAKE
jgi:uncharacterized protein